MNRFEEAEIVISDGNKAIENFEASDSEFFMLGCEIEIKLGYHNKNQSVFKGLVSQQRIIVDGIKGNRFVVDCKSNLEIISIGLDSMGDPELEVQYGYDILELDLSIFKKEDSRYLSKLKGFMMFQGSPKAKVNSLIRLKGLSNKFNGDHPITGIEHVLEEGKWITKVLI